MCSPPHEEESLIQSRGRTSGDRGWMISDTRVQVVPSKGDFVYLRFFEVGMFLPKNQGN
jgi:hypothetical protein